MPVLPILRLTMVRSLPQTFRGGQLSANEIAGLTLYAGQFRGNSPRNDASMQDMSLFGRPAATSDRFDFAGGEYRFNGERTLLGLWNAELKDIYRQQYPTATQPAARRLAAGRQPRRLPWPRRWQRARRQAR